MGSLWSSPFQQLAGALGPRSCCILMLGPDQAGKRTILHHLATPRLLTLLLRRDDSDHHCNNVGFIPQLYDWLCTPHICVPVHSYRPNPAWGFTVSELTYQNLQLAVWDAGGQRITRAVWNHYYRYADALIYVVDSSNSTDRLIEDGPELQRLLGEIAALGNHTIPLLVFANKQDLPSAADIHTVGSCLGLCQNRDSSGTDLQLFPWYIQSCSAKLNQGLLDGMDWPAQEIAS